MAEIVGGTLIRILVLIFVLTNAAAFVMMGIDKRRAVRDSWRIPERTLLAACGLFAALGGLIGMYVFRHKTRKLKFSLGVPAMLVVQAALLYAVWALIG